MGKRQPPTPPTNFYEDYSILSPNRSLEMWESSEVMRELVELQKMPLDSALNLLSLRAKLAGGWNDELNWLGLRLLKPNARPGLEIHA